MIYSVVNFKFNCFILVTSFSTKIRLSSILIFSFLFSSAEAA